MVNKMYICLETTLTKADGSKPGMLLFFFKVILNGINLFQRIHPWLDLLTMLQTRFSVTVKFI